MGVYINMEMPKTGRYFVAVDYTDGKNKTVISVMSEFERGDKTRPLLAVHEVIHVPAHGRLIDADALEKDIDKYIGGEETRSRFHHWVQVQRTVIPESKEART